MAEERCGTADLITEAAGPDVRGTAAMVIEETFAEQEYFYFSAENGSEGGSSFGLRFPVDRHVRDVESSPVTVENVEKSEYRGTCSSAVRAELEGQETACTFESGEIPRGVNASQRGWMFSWKPNGNDLIIKAKARLIARGFGERFAVGYFEMVAATSAMISIKVIMPEAVQEGWPAYHPNVEWALVRAKVHTDVSMEPPDERDPLAGKTVRLREAIHGIKQAGRQLSLLLNKTLMEEAGMTQSTTDPCVCKQEERGACVCNRAGTCGRHLDRRGVMEGGENV